MEFSGRQPGGVNGSPAAPRRFLSDIQKTCLKLFGEVKAVSIVLMKAVKGFHLPLFYGEDFLRGLKVLVASKKFRKS